MSSTVLVLGNDGENVEWNEWVEEVDSKVFELGGITEILWNYGKEGLDEIPIDAIELTREVKESLIMFSYNNETRRMNGSALKRFMNDTSIKTMMKHDRRKLYEGLKSMTVGLARQEVRRLGVENVHLARETLKKIYSKKADLEMKRIERLVEAGISREDGTKFGDNDDLQKHVQGFEKLVDELRGMVKKENLDAYIYSKPDNMSKYFARGLPPSYTDILTNISLMKELVNTNNSKGEVDTGADSYPHWPQFKTLLLRLYNMKLARQDDLKAEKECKKSDKIKVHAVRSNENDSNKPCRHYSQGNCKYGDACKFSHEDYYDSDGKEKPNSNESKEKDRGQWVFKSESEFKKAAQKYMEREVEKTSAWNQLIEKLAEVHNEAKDKASTSSESRGSSSSDNPVSEAKRKIAHLLKIAKKARAFED